MKISHCRVSPDGRSLVSSLCIGRVALHSIQEDQETAYGLLTAEIERINDDEAEEHKHNEADHQLYERLYSQFLLYCQSASIPLPRLITVHGDVPPSPHLTDLTWWLARALPHSALHHRLLHSRSVSERYHLCLELCKQAKDSEQHKAAWQGRAVIIIALFAFLLHFWHR